MKLRLKLPKIFNRKRDSREVIELPRNFYYSSGGSHINPDTAMQVSAFYSGLIYLSTSISKLPWYIKDKNNNIIDNGVAKLLGLVPNPRMNSFYFRLLNIQEAILKGNSYNEIERDLMGQPKAIWPLKHDAVQPIILNDQLYYHVAGGAADGGDVYLLPKDVFHVRNFHTKDGIVGQGVVAYARDTLGIATGADKFSNALFTNGGLPSGVLKVSGSLSPEAAKRLKESWDTSHGGRKVGGTAVLEEGAEYSPISFTPEMLQFLESRKFSVIEIARFLRVPPSKLYDVDVASYNNIEHSNLEVAIDVLDAWCRNIEMETDVKILNEGYGGRKSELDIYAVFRGDMETRSQYFSRMMQISSITPNEVRIKEGLAPYDGGDRFYLATNNYTPMDRVDEVVDAQIKPKEVAEKKEPDSVDKAVENFLNSKL